MSVFCGGALYSRDGPKLGGDYCPLSATGRPGCPLSSVRPDPVGDVHQVRGVADYHLRSDRTTVHPEVSTVFPISLKVPGSPEVGTGSCQVWKFENPHENTTDPTPTTK